MWCKTKVPSSTEWSTMSMDYAPDARWKYNTITTPVSNFARELSYVLDYYVRKERNTFFGKRCISRVTSVYVYRPVYNDNVFRVVFTCDDTPTEKMLYDYEVVMVEAVLQLNVKQVADMRIQLKISNMTDNKYNYYPGMELGWTTVAIVSIDKDKGVNIDPVEWCM